MANEPRAALRAFAPTTPTRLRVYALTHTAAVESGGRQSKGR